jgi:hypothetical protein
MMKKIGMLISLLGLAALFCSGCAAVVVGAGAGAVAYVAGEVQRDYPAPYAKVVTRAEQVIAQLEIVITETSRGGMETWFEGHNQQGTPVRIRVSTLGPEVTKVGVRVGHVGLWDRERAEAIHGYIAQRL